MNGFNFLSDAKATAAKAEEAKAAAALLSTAEKSIKAAEKARASGEKPSKTARGTRIRANAGNGAPVALSASDRAALGLGPEDGVTRSFVLETLLDAEGVSPEAGKALDSGFSGTLGFLRKRGFPTRLVKGYEPNGRRGARYFFEDENGARLAALYALPPAARLPKSAKRETSGNEAAARALRDAEKASESAAPAPAPKSDGKPRGGFRKGR